METRGRLRISERFISVIKEKTVTVTEKRINLNITHYKIYVVHLTEDFGLTVKNLPLTS